MRIGLLLLACIAAFAAGKTNLTGDWVLNIGESNFAKEAPPKSKKISVKHKDPVLEITTTEEPANGPSASLTMKYTTDGKEATNSVFGNPMKAVTRYEGKVLFMRTTGTFGTNEIILEDRYELSKNRKKLIIKRHFEGKQRGGIQDQVLVLDRQ